MPRKKSETKSETTTSKVETEDVQTPEDEAGGPPEGNQSAMAGRVRDEDDDKAQDDAADSD